MSAQIIRFPLKPDIRTYPSRQPEPRVKLWNDGWFEQEMRAALKRVFGDSAKPCDSE